MPKIFNAKSITFEQRKSRIPEFLWHTSPRLAELSNAKYLQFDIRSLDPGKINILPYMNIFESSSAVNYYKGEEGALQKWPKELIRKE